MGPYLYRKLDRVRLPPGERFGAQASDGRVGPVTLSGHLHRPVPRHFGDHAIEPTVVVLIHGLGGDAESAYLRLGTRAALAAGVAALRLNLRGAGPEPTDFYHAGLTGDLACVLRRLEALGFERVLLLGYSLGGHLVLRYLGEQGRPAPHAAASLCAPTDLARAAHHLDRPRNLVYRESILRSLRKMVAQTAGKLPKACAPTMALESIRTFRAWDEHVVAPRHGFAGAEDYWSRVSAGQLLCQITRPTLMVHTSKDPVLPSQEGRLHQEPTLAPAVTQTELNCGGHIGFPPWAGRRELDSAGTQSGPRNLHDRIITWMLKQSNDKQMNP